MLLADAPPTALDTVHTVFDIIGAAVTAIAVIVGAIWAYYKFVAGRTFKQKLEIKTEQEWLKRDDDHFAHVRVTLSNIGASKVSIVTQGTALLLYSMKATVAGMTDPEWDEIRVQRVFGKASWLEPGEQVVEEVIVRTDAPNITKCWVRVVAAQHRKDNLEVGSTTIFGLDATFH